MHVLFVAAVSFLSVLMVELPDKTLVATLVLTSRYRRAPVLIGVAAAFAVQCVLAVTAGGLLALLPGRVVGLAVAALFAVGAAVLLRQGFAAAPEEAPSATDATTSPRRIAAVTDSTKVIFLCTPNNPTGAALSARELTDFLDRVPTHVLVVVDEAYVEYNDALDVMPAAALLERRNVILLRTFSKAYGLAGLRVGYAVAADPRVAAAVRQTGLPFAVSRPRELRVVAAGRGDRAVGASMRGRWRDRPPLCRRRSAGDGVDGAGERPLPRSRYRGAHLCRALTLTAVNGARQPHQNDAAMMA